MTEDEVRERFLAGMELFKEGKSQPTEREKRIESLGWRHARKAATDLQLTIETVIEGYCEKEYQDPFKDYSLAFV